ncbi:hypothetical protein [Streptomyces sp. NPDC090994]|uniref:hypothetical protein n=1 Tax=Streptomyces sp. NPDC090994 TaxID=3365969 RepID=UPI0037F525B0
MSERDDFNAKTLEELAKRVAFRCSAPSCDMATIGPSDSRRSGVSNIGVGAHITAAAKGGPRYNKELSPQQRAAYDNGIWLCGNHAKLIDDNEDRYPVRLLSAWKRSAERNARLRVGRPTREQAPSLLVDHDIVIPDGDPRQLVLDFFEDIGASRAWGREIHDSTFFFVYEVALNAFAHGRSESLSLKTRKGCLYILYTGQKFGPLDLDAITGQGGAAALKSFRRQCNGYIELAYRHREGLNEWVLIDLARSLNHRHPCGLQLTRNVIAAGDYNRVKGCAEVHLYVPQMFSFSDTGRLARQLIAHLPDRCYVLHNVSNDPGLRAYITDKLPRVRFVPA